MAIRRLEIRPLPVHHIAPKGGVVGGKTGIAGNARNGAQRFGKRVVAIGRKLVAAGIGVSLHDFPHQGGNLYWVIVFADDMQIVDMEYQGRIALLLQAGE